MSEEYEGRVAAPFGDQRAEEPPRHGRGQGGRTKALVPEGARGVSDRRWFRPDHAGWDPRLYEWFFDTPLGGALRAREEATIYGFLDGVLERAHSVLEVGCGTGNYTIPVARRCARTVAVDASPEMLRYARERLDREGLFGVETRLGRLPAGPGPEGGFDGALAIGVLNYVRDIEGALKRLISSLKTGGWAVFNVPARSAEGRIYALAELVNRRRIYLYSLPEIVRLGKRIGLRVEAAATAGLSRGGITVVVVATKASPEDFPEEPKPR